MICEKEHKDETVRALRGHDVPQSQKLDHRHLCAACAYEAGYLDGMRSVQNLLRLAVADVEAEINRR